MTPTIFLSYASQDADAAHRICVALRAAGLVVWFDQSELRGGDAWDTSIRKQIKECTLFVPIISDNTNAREEGYFRLEWKLAVDRSHLMADHKAFFLPVVWGDVLEASAYVPDKFRERQWSRLHDNKSISDFAKRTQQIVSSPGGVAGAIMPQLEKAEIERVRHKPTESLEAHESQKSKKLTECPTCGHGGTWADKPNVLWACNNSKCGNESDKYCYQCGSWDIWINTCRCRHCKKKGEKVAVFTVTR